VSHFNLTIHLLLALSLFGLAVWTAFGHKYGFPQHGRTVRWSRLSRLALLSFILLIIQIVYGGFTAGLKAGYISNTWPLMFGAWIPANLFSSLINIVESPQTVVFIHRWFAFAVLIAMTALFFAARKQIGSMEIKNGLSWLLALVVFQIVLGILTVLLHVQLAIALSHQAGALALFALMIYFLHRLRALDAS
jgi:cytochrome c oxidase assembly protein subunit 15